MGSEGAKIDCWDGKSEAAGLWRRRSGDSLEEPVTGLGDVAADNPAAMAAGGREEREHEVRREECDLDGESGRRPAEASGMGDLQFAINKWKKATYYPSAGISFLNKYKRGRRWTLRCCLQSPKCHGQESVGHTDQGKRRRKGKFRRLCINDLI